LTLPILNLFLFPLSASHLLTFKGAEKGKSTTAGTNRLVENGLNELKFGPIIYTEL
jgi:hypothetical protein